ncbi:hypothetical protein B0H13DRAFT_2374977 [Mycena leptocephala]|nr:hypothetical protein B0H13DRAFT_2374977 [Mycena leptocephala]
MNEFNLRYPQYRYFSLFPGEDDYLYHRLPTFPTQPQLTIDLGLVKSEEFDPNFAPGYIKYIMWVGIRLLGTMPDQYANYPFYILASSDAQRTLGPGKYLDPYSRQLRSASILRRLILCVSSWRIQSVAAPLKRTLPIHGHCVWMELVPGASPKSSMFHVFFSCVSVECVSSRCDHGLLAALQVPLTVWINVLDVAERLLADGVGPFPKPSSCLCTLLISRTWPKKQERQRYTP